MNLADVDWRAPIVCDGCHATLAELGSTGHRGECRRNGRHMHHTSTPITDCVFYQEWQAELTQEAVQEWPGPQVPALS